MGLTLFNEREQAFEAKFAHEAENEFLVRTKGGAMFVKWIAGLVDLSEEEAAQHANRMVEAVMNGQTDKSILSTVSAELNGHGQEVSPRQLATRLIECRAEARRQLYAS